MKYIFMLCMLICVLFSGLSAAETVSRESTALVFKEERIDQVATVEDIMALGVFSFTNKSQETITLDSFGSLNIRCHCNVAKIDKLVYLPGESGEIRIELDLRKGSGIVNATIPISYTVGDKKYMRKISLRVSLPSILSITPSSSCMWQVAKRLTWAEKTLSLKVNEDTAGKDYKVLFIDDTEVDAFIISYEMKDGRPFVLGEDRWPDIIKVVPLKGAQQSFQNINIFTSHKLRHHKKMSIRLMVVG